MMMMMMMMMTMCEDVSEVWKQCQTTYFLKDEN